jgi:hypothetical protein
VYAFICILSIHNIIICCTQSDVQCLHRWQKVLRPGLVKGPWSAAEDKKVIEMVGKYGLKKWSVIAKHLQGRLGKQCRERWYNHLNPHIRRYSRCLCVVSVSGLR